MQRNHSRLLTARPQTSIRGGDDEDADDDLNRTLRELPEQVLECWVTFHPLHNG
jgi:hypothetical protein